MTTLDPEKLLQVLQAQQDAIESLNDATRQDPGCGCCRGSAPADREVRGARAALDALTATEG